MSDEAFPMPETVRFISNGAECVAHKVFDQYGLNMKSCQVNFAEKRPTVEIEPILGFCRVRLNGGEVWFDTDADSAGAIAELFSA